MNDYSELKRLADAAQHDRHLGALEDYADAATPAVVLALIAENEAIKAQFDECARLFVDATEQACKAQRERDQLKAENESLRAALEVAALAMWNSEANMDSEAAAVEEALANAAMSQGEKSGG